MNNTREKQVRLAIAGLGVALHCEHAGLVEALQDRYQGFLHVGKPHFSIDVHLKGKIRSSPLEDIDLQFEGEEIRFSSPGFVGNLNTQKGTGELHLSTRYPIDDIDYLLRVAYALLAFQAGGVMLHAAGIARNSQVYLFVGHSGSGKTTISRLSPDCTVLNDDLVVLLPEADLWRVYGTPFWNQTQIEPVPASAPLRAIYCLEQARHNQLELLPGSRAVAELVANTPIIPDDTQRSVELMHRYFQVIQTTPVRKLSFLPEASFWDLILDQGD